MQKNKLLSSKKIPALKIKPGDEAEPPLRDRIVAYFRNKMQVCTVKKTSTCDRS